MIKNIKTGEKYPSQPKLAVGAVVFKDQGDKVEKKPKKLDFSIVSRYQSLIKIT